MTFSIRLNICHFYPLQYSCLENPMDRGAWWAAVHGVAKSQTQLSNFTFTFHFHALEKEMATHSSNLAWRIPGTEETGGLSSLGSHRVGHDWSDLAVAVAISIYADKIHALLNFNHDLLKIILIFFFNLWIWSYKVGAYNMAGDVRTASLIERHKFPFMM